LWKTFYTSIQKRVGTCDKDKEPPMKPTLSGMLAPEAGVKDRVGGRNDAAAAVGAIQRSSVRCAGCSPEIAHASRAREVRSGRGDAGGCYVLKSDLKLASVQRTPSFASGFVLKTLGKNFRASQRSENVP
jgi:hypothetical protein